MTWYDGPTRTSYFGRGRTPKMAATAAILESFRTPYRSYLCTNFLEICVMTWNDGPMGTSYFGHGQTSKMAAIWPPWRPSWISSARSTDSIYVSIFLKLCRMTCCDESMRTSNFCRGRQPRMAATAAILDFFSTVYRPYLCINFLETLQDDML